MRIYITGASGTGKTTLAHKLAKIHKIKWYETDVIAWNDKEKRMLTEEEISSVIPVEKDWIIEGSYLMPNYLCKADYVIYLKSTPLRSLRNIWQRRAVDTEQKKKYSFWDTIKLSWTTLRDRYISEGIDPETAKNRFYREKDRYRIAEALATEMIISTSPEAVSIP